MKRFKTIGLGLALMISSTAMAKTEQVKLTRAISFGEEAVFVSTTKGQVILNYYALSDQAARALVKPTRKGQCLEIKSKNGFFKETGDGALIQSIRPCPKTKS